MWMLGLVLANYCMDLQSSLTSVREFKVYTVATVITHCAFLLNDPSTSTLLNSWNVYGKVLEESSRGIYDFEQLISGFSQIKNHKVIEQVLKEMDPNLVLTTSDFITICMVNHVLMAFTPVLVVNDIKKLINRMRFRVAQYCLLFNDQQIVRHLLQRDYVHRSDWSLWSGSGSRQLYFFFKDKFKVVNQYYALQYDIIKKETVQLPYYITPSIHFEGKTCAICLSDFIENSIVVSTKCGHLYHRECIMEGIMDHELTNCPVCRKTLK